jgi:hypothetical protein
MTSRFKACEDRGFGDSCIDEEADLMEASVTWTVTIALPDGNP